MTLLYVIGYAAVACLALDVLIDLFRGNNVIPKGDSNE